KFLLLLISLRNGNIRLLSQFQNLIRTKQKLTLVDQLPSRLFFTSFRKNFDSAYYPSFTNREKIPPSVNGFLPLRDNQLAVYKIHTAISEAHSHKKYFIGINLGIKSAYDTVCIDGLIFKCLHLGINDNITKVLHNFLQNRTLQVRWRNSLSGTKPVQKGLPQGSVVSPILFVCFLADFSETLDVGAEYLIFADDIFIFCAHTSLDHISKKLQNTMGNVYKWCNYWKLIISPEKCSIADLSKKKLQSIPRITYAGFPLP
ncbi:hypothetical protein AVEN_176671-1, partial [Araneus ventricosus]